MSNFSLRKYIVVGFEMGTRVEVTISLSDLLKDYPNGYECMYALQEETDKILDLKVNETMFVSLNRDNVDCKGVICRIS